jgi:thiamine pyrophosphate-dependent acetolactate synthase large subunit-like protein
VVAFGGEGCHVDDPKDLRKALEAAMTYTGFVGLRWRSNCRRVVAGAGGYITDWGKAA